MIKDIIKGHINEALSINEDLSKARMAICEACPLFLKTKVGPLCNSKLYLEPNTKEVSDSMQDGYIKGCGCRLNAKTSLKESKCPTGQW